MKQYKFGIWLVILLLCGINAQATHTVGGVFTYRCLGNNVYEIRLDIYQDCKDGLPDAIQADNPAYLAIRSIGDNSYVRFDSVNFVQNQEVPPNFSNECINNPPIVCLRRVSFVKQYQLPANAGGYIISYVRCCRNNSIINIQNPGNTGTYNSITIPPQGPQCNSSPIFKNFPPQIICINNPLIYDHGATDIDSDSLSYEFCNGFNYSPLDANNAKPNPLTVTPVSVSYVGNYTAQKPMAGNPLVTIDPKTGVITGTPNVQGRFVVTVCCNEWRNGVKVNTIRREFQFVVTNCSRAVVANTPLFSNEPNTYIIQCEGKTVTFLNTSTNAFQYYWDFGVPGATSTDREPTYTYADTGTYIIKLVVNRGSTCPDSISRIVKVYPDFKADFSFTGLPCPNSPFTFVDQSVATYGPVSKWSWNFGDGNTSTEQNPAYAYPQGGDYTVALISGNAKGCLDTASKVLFVEKFSPFAGNDTVIVKGETINFNAVGGIFYTWTPATQLTSGFIGNPTGYYPDTGVYRYNVHIKSESDCEGNDSVNVRVVNQPALFVPSGFTPNGDGRNDYLRPIGIGYRELKFFRVFNRFGQLVYETNTLGQGWDGGFKGKKAELGTYFWVLNVINRAGREEQIKGDATLIR